MKNLFLVFFLMLVGCKDVMPPQDEFGCTDADACNYQPDAVFEDGSCEFPSEFYNCDGNCFLDYDCNGVCGGDAVVDDCGVCEGDGIAEGGCDCDGNILDCFGECGGNAVEDECGVCGGDGSSCQEFLIEFGNIDQESGSAEILLTNSLPIEGFQFSLSGIDINAAYGGLSEQNGFTISTLNSSPTVLGFSFPIGSTIPAGSGVLLYIDGTFTDQTVCLTDFLVAADIDAEAEVGDCWVLDEVLTQTSLILFNVDLDISAFQFDVNDLYVFDAYGGEAGDAGFTISFSNTSVLGFSFDEIIPAGQGVLLEVVHSPTRELCISNLILTGIDGSTLNSSVDDCLTIISQN